MHARFADRLWFHCILAVGAGALASLAQAPWYWTPLFAVGLSLLFILCDRTTRKRRALLLGWCFGSGYFFVGIQWVGEAFLVDAEKFAWMMPFAIAFLAALLGLFPALACAAARLGGRGTISHALAFILAWAVSEWLRGIAFTGFPWHHPGYVWTAGDAFMQGAALVGLQTMGLIAVAAAIAPGIAVSVWPNSRILAGGALIVPIAVVGAIWIYGDARLAGASAAMATPPVHLRIVQPVLAQKDKWKRELRDVHLRNYLQLTAEPAPTTPTHVIWPETATPFALLNDEPRRRLVAANLPRGSRLLTGTPRYEGRGHALQAFNSLVMLDEHGRTTLLYDKRHLVPFGEYLPFRNLLSMVGLDRLAVSPVDFSTGRIPTVAPVPGAPPVRPLICYEVIFPAEMATESRAGWLLNITNDAWFGDSAGPHQHLAIARMRAVEQGLPLVRAANTGISALIDPYGRLLASLDIGVRGVIDADLPAKLASPTMYAVYGDVPFLIILMLLVPGWAVTWHRDRLSEPPSSA